MHSHAGAWERGERGDYRKKLQRSKNKANFFLKDKPRTEIKKYESVKVLKCDRN